MITLIRHGETIGNIEKRYIGSTDEPLSENGISNIKKLKESRLYPSVSAVFSSPMKRCVETASIIYPDIAPKVVDELREISFGEFEGLTHGEIIKIAGRGVFDKTPEGVSVLPGVESFELFRERCVGAFAGILSAIDENDDVAVIIHGGVIMSAMSRLFASEGFYEYWVENGRGYNISKKGNSFTSERL